MTKNEKHSPTPEEMELRRLLWLRHGCPVTSLYGDDGHMQCSKCLIDFKRSSAEQIEERWHRIAEQKLAEERRRQRTERTGTPDTAVFQCPEPPSFEP